MTRTLILSDIHGNKDALDAVVADAGHAERIWCLGDIVGYGPEPGACVAWVRAHCDIVLSGNHDYAAFDPSVVRDFNPNAALAAEWTRDQLTDEQVAYLQSLPSLVEADGVSTISFTGSTSVGRHIAGRCGHLMKRVSCELGG